jgi:membrane fusion protein, heavy metal efflux system
MRGLAPICAVCATLAGVLVAGCSREQKVDAASATAMVEPPADPNTFTVDKPNQFPLVSAATRSVRDAITANGVVAPDVSRNVGVTSLASGRVVEIDARLGDHVQKGQVLLKISSPDLESAFADYQKAAADEILTRRALVRERDLLAHGAAAQKDVDTAEDAEQKALVDVRATAAKIRILGGSVAEPSPIIAVAAPVSGTIVDQQITADAGVKSLDATPNLFTIADLSRVWILCDVYENDLARVRVGDMAEVRLDAYPNRILRGRVSNISSVLDPATRSAKVRLEVANPDGLLRPGMFAEARFFSQRPVDRVAVPASAILRLHDKDWVFRPVSFDQFRRTQIQGGATTPDGYQFVLSGLTPGERVVKNALELSATVEK